MLDNGRLSAARSWAYAREQFARIIAENDALQHELATVRAQFDRLRQEIAELRDITSDVVRGLREQADADVMALRHRLAAALLRLAQRDGQPLQ